MEKEQKSGHLVLVTVPFQGHMTPMLQLATILHSKGFSITIVHPELNFPDTSDHPEFAFVSIPDNLAQSQLLDGDLAGLALCLNKNCAAPIRQCLEQIEHSNGRITAVLYDLLMFCAQTVADDLRLPGISLRTSSATTLLFFPQLDEKDFISEIDSPELQALRLPRLRALISRHPTEAMTEMRISLTNAMKSSSAIILNSMAFLEQEAISKVKEYFPASIFAIGPLHKLAPTICISILTEDDECIAWLDKQAPESVIYVSFGSMASIEEHELIEMAWGLVDGGQPFLWTVRPGMVRGSEWIEPLPDGFEDSMKERGRIMKWTPQKEVLAHGAVGGFWSHCGWNSTVESVCEGVPMLCRPFFGDQLLNSSYICNVWKIGLELQEIKRGNIKRTIQKLMVDMEGSEIRKRAMDLKEKAIFCLMEHGSSSCSLNELTKHISSASETRN